MTTKVDAVAWLQQHLEDYRVGKMGLSEVVEDFDNVKKLGYGFASVDELEEVDLEEGDVKKPTYISVGI
jgi:hypothetical protein